MESFKKVISLNEASKQSGYTQDYLGYLIRNGDIKAKKVGRAWFTTKEAIDNYLFKQKIQHKELAISDFFSRRRTKNILIFGLLLFVGVISILSYLSNLKNLTEKQTVNQTLSSEIENLTTIKK